MWSANPLDGIDLSVLEFLASHRNPVADLVPVTLGVAGTDVVTMAVLQTLALVIALFARAWRQLAAVVLAVGIAGTGVSALKDVIARPRPPADLTMLAGEGFAFPSTHAAFTSAAATAFVAVTAWRSRRARAVVIALLGAAVALVGFSMVYLGSHWVSDVLVGWLIGVPLGAGLGRLLRRRPRADGEALPSRGSTGSRGPTDEDAPVSDHGSV